MENPVQSKDEVEIQHARAILRKSFLNGISDLTAQPCKILCYENTLVQGKLTVWNPNGSDVLIKDLETPTGMKMESALLRNSDILAVQFDKLLT